METATCPTAFTRTSCWVRTHKWQGQGQGQGKGRREGLTLLLLLLQQAQRRAISARPHCNHPLDVHTAQQRVPQD